ncbi:MAG: DNA methyltransferase [Patescibacteria group bacterium]
MKYFFVLGTNTALSLAELAAVLDIKEPRLLATDFLAAEVEREIDTVKLIARLGGIIKIGRIIKEIPVGEEKNLVAEIQEIAAAKQASGPTGKFNFGFSNYGKGEVNKNDLGLKAKKYFTEKKISSRFVVSREKTLSSVVITQNKLISRGIEVVLIKNNNQWIIGETLAVQPFKDLSRRDFGRPARDDRSGMLPPKLAQIMINLAQITDENAVIIDPFCGSGTILSEAALLGYKKLFGSDISPKAIDDTYKNLSWLKELYKIEDCRTKLVVKNAVDIAKFIKAGSGDAIITEPFLGPQRGMINFKPVIAELEELYSAALVGFKEVLKPGGRVVMIWPLFYGQRPIAPRYEGFKILNMVPASLRQSEFIKKTGRDTIVYGRPGQKVYREVVVMERV